jgi:hypothetical protein
LLAIASDDRADPNEAAAAAGMAEKVMRKYQIDHAELIMNGLKQGHDLSTEDVVATAKTNGTKVKQVPAWAGWIAVAVSKFTECSASVVTTPSGEKTLSIFCRKRIKKKPSKRPASGRFRHFALMSTASLRCFMNLWKSCRVL